ncbi:MAG: hypothetical protein NZM04_10720 [Methylacidiphilales bacterium]|nr:hypothetical protein [Candidatus Methylacidiphilales bacterium]MDW8349096.1 hypothetical protein [Verrucomicrobiae bacterium]
MNWVLVQPFLLGLVGVGLFLGVELRGEEDLDPLAVPRGGVVIGGEAELKTFEGRHLIRAGTERVAIRYDGGFNIGVKGTVDVEGLPGGAALIQDANDRMEVSRLYGQLNANVDVMVLNPNGVVIGRDFKADTRSLMVGALQGVADEFMKQDRIVLSGVSDGAKVVNHGAVLGKDVVLLAPRVEDVVSEAVRAEGERFVVQLNPENGGGAAIRIRLPDSSGGVLKTNPDQIYARAMNTESLGEERVRVLRNGQVVVRNVPGGRASSSRGSNPPLITVNQVSQVPRGLVDIGGEKLPALDVTDIRRAEPVVVGGAVVSNPRPAVMGRTLPGRVEEIVLEASRVLPQEVTFKEFPRLDRQQEGRRFERRRAKIRIKDSEMDSNDDRGYVNVVPLPPSVVLVESVREPNAPKIQITNTEIALDREAEDTGEVVVLPSVRGAGR